MTEQILQSQDNHDRGEEEGELSQVNYSRSWQKIRTKKEEGEPGKRNEGEMSE